MHKILVAPEYFFSKDRKNYDRFFCHDMKRWIVARLSALATNHPDFIFIPGTVLWSKPMKNIEQRAEERQNARTRQVYPQNEIGETITLGAHKNHSRVLKFLDSTSKQQPDDDEVEKVNLCRNSTYICLNHKVVKYHKRVPYNEVFREDDEKVLVFGTGNVEGTFTVQGVKYGIEICADHGSRTLANSGINIHLVVSSWIGFGTSDASLVLHASTQLPSPVAKTDPVVPNDSNVKVHGMLRLASCKVFAIDVPGVTVSGEYELQGFGVQNIHDMGALEQFLA